ncbi:MAG: hypothetical protein RLZZ435_1199 [Cyanobacteriota bacterium]|jgi:uncharacterized protein (DUF433 family)
MTSSSSSHLESTWEQSVHNVPVYSVTNASRYLHIPRTTLINWLKAQFCSSYTLQTGHKYRLPLIQRPVPEMSQLSFTNLVEAHLLRVIQASRKVSLSQVRIALDHLNTNLNTNLQTPHPLVESSFRVKGSEQFIKAIFPEEDGKKMLNILDKLLDRLEWDKTKKISKLFPFIGDDLFDNAQKVITIDPQVSFGKPTITGTGIPTEVIFDFYQAGDSIDTIAEEYRCSPEIIKSVIEFEDRKSKNHYHAAA